MKPVRSLSFFISTLALLPTPWALAEALPPAVQAIEARGAKVVGSFDAPGGLKGYAARYNGQGIALYLTPDGDHVVIGSLLDAVLQHVLETGTALGRSRRRSAPSRHGRHVAPGQRRQIRCAVGRERP